MTFVVMVNLIAHTNLKLVEVVARTSRSIKTHAGHSLYEFEQSEFKCVILFYIVLRCRVMIDQIRDDVITGSFEGPYLRMCKRHEKQQPLIYDQHSRMGCFHQFLR